MNVAEPLRDPEFFCPQNPVERTRGVIERLPRFCRHDVFDQGVGRVAAIAGKVEDRELGAFRAEILLKLGGGRQLRAEIPDHHVEIMVALALRELRIVDPRMNGVDTESAKILDIRIDDAVKCLRIIQDLDLQCFAGRVSPHPVITNRPARLVEEC